MNQAEYDKMVRKHCCQLSQEVQIRTGFRTRGEMEKSIRGVLKNKQIMSRFRVEQLAEVSMPKLLEVFYSLREAGGQVAFTLDDAGVRSAAGRPLAIPSAIASSSRGPNLDFIRRIQAEMGPAPPVVVPVVPVAPAADPLFSVAGNILSDFYSELIDFVYTGRDDEIEFTSEQFDRLPRSKQIDVLNEIGEMEGVAPFGYTAVNGIPVEAEQPIETLVGDMQIEDLSDEEESLEQTFASADE